MQEAIRLSLETMRNNKGGPFGAVVVKDGIIIARGSNRVVSTNDPTAHAEVVAIREACSKLNSFQLEDCEIYTSCEPCPMCMAAIYWARPRIVYFGNSKEDAAEIGFDDSFIYEELVTPLLQRKIPMVRIQQDEALKAFREWAAKPDKIRY
ncbi:MAG: nucleoside deaminase [Bacteroidia bacterium]|nr:nucleoside deaminase [Bacteroidia bacterium]